MAVRRWVDLSRYDGAEMLIATGCPPDGGHRLAVRNYVRSDLSQFGFTRLQGNVWLGSVPTFKTSDLRQWFPGFDPTRDIREFETSAFLVGYEDLDLANADFELDDLIAKAADANTHPSRDEQARRARAEVTPEQIAGVLADFPSSGALLAQTRSYTEEVFQRVLDGITLPEEAEARVDTLQPLLAQKRQALQTLADRYDELHSRGLDAVSDYDILIAFQGKALFALRGSLNYQRSLINDELDQILALTVAAREAEEQVRAAEEAQERAGRELLARKGDILVDENGENAWRVDHDVVTDNPFIVYVTVNRDQLNERSKSVNAEEFRKRVAENEAFRAKARDQASENKTPGTNVKWATLGEWVKGWRALDRRAPSATRHEELESHVAALASKVDVITSESKEAVLVAAKRLIEQLQPPRGTRERHPTTEILHRVGTRLNQIRNAARDAGYRDRLASAKAIGEANGMQQEEYSDGSSWEKGTRNDDTHISLRVYSPLHSGKTKYSVIRAFDGEYASGTYDTPEEADQAIKALTRAVFEAIANPTERARTRIAAAEKAARAAGLVPSGEVGTDWKHPSRSDQLSLSAHAGPGTTDVFTVSRLKDGGYEYSKHDDLADAESVLSQWSRDADTYDQLDDGATAVRVRQFAVAMRSLGLEMDGLNPRSWSVDLGSGHEVHAELDDHGASIQVRRLAWEEWVEEWDGPYSAEATRQVGDFVRRAMQAPATEEGADAEQDGEQDLRVKALQERVSRFASGMSRAKDFHPATRAEHGVGVDIGELSDSAMRELADRIVNMRAQVFVDSGAFGLFKRGLKSGDVRPMDFDAVLNKYELLQQYIAEANPAEEKITPPMFVMPDVVGDQAASLDLVAQYRKWIKVETEFQVSRPVVPLQRGELSLSEAYTKVVEILGSDRFIVGIPSNAAAITPDEFIAFLRESKLKAVHILGALADSRLAPRLQQIVEAGVDADIEVSADANVLRSKILTKDAPVGARAARIEEALSQAAIQADQVQAQRAKDREAAANEATGVTVEDLDAAVEAVKTAATLADTGFSVQEDGRFRKILFRGKQVCSVEGKLTRGVVLTALQDNAEAERHRVDLLREVASIRRGEHSGFRGLSDAIANADFFLSQYAREKPELAKAAAAAWLGQHEHYSAVSGLSPARVRQLGNYLFAQHKIAIANQEVERTRAQAHGVEAQADSQLTAAQADSEAERPAHWSAMFGAIKDKLTADPEWQTAAATQALGHASEAPEIERRAKLVLEAAVSLYRTDEASVEDYAELVRIWNEHPAQFAGLVGVLLASEPQAARQRSADLEANERYRSGHWTEVPDSLVPTESLAKALAAAYRGVDLDNHYQAVQSGDEWRVEIRFRGTDQYDVYRNDLDYFRERGTLETAGLFEFIRTDTRLQAGEFERLLAYAGMEPDQDKEDDGHRLTEDEARAAAVAYVAFLISKEGISASESLMPGIYKGHTFQTWAGAGAGVKAKHLMVDAPLGHQFPLTSLWKEAEAAIESDQSAAAAAQETDAADGTRVEEQPVRRRRAAKNPDGARERILDAGEKIGGARKDFYSSALRVEDLADMNDREKLELVTKDNVWPSRSVADYRESGVDARVALFIQTMRREFPAAPKQLDHVEIYVDMARKLQDVAAKMKTKDDLPAFEDGLVNAGVLVREERQYGTSRSLPSEYGDMLYAASRSGFRFVNRYLFDAEDGFRRAVYPYHSKQFRIGEEWLRPRDMDSEGFYDFLEAQRQQVADKRRQTMENRQSGDTDKQALARPHLAKVIRDGLPDERRGRNIAPDDLLDDFGFRACEFGNWLPDTERQDVLNRAYDALCTLARVLDVDKKALSLDGTLALAFGSRGVGRALAHYECARKVINLTRLRGAGSLAHEWWHAFDDYVGDKLKAEAVDKRAPMAPTLTNTYFASELFLAQQRGRRRGDFKTVIYANWNKLPADMEEMRPLLKLVDTISIRPWSDEEVLRAVQNDLAKEERALLTSLENILLAAQPGASMEVVKQTSRKYLDKLRLEANDPDARKCIWAKHPLQDALRELPVAGLTGKAKADHDVRLMVLGKHIRGYIQAYAFCSDDALRRECAHAQNRTYTQYAVSAQHFDKKKAQPYWSQMRELSARAFESYVQDEIEANGWREDYLVHGTEEAAHDARPHSAYPVGRDRAAINAAMKDYLDVARSKFEMAPQAIQTQRPKAA
ncbi:LPD1 domain-containing protein [Cupriavidus sp. BIC8F]|uniref:LPD1 domain-containing protein n=1 Tax=Cupriavidus sp. BIC8F TaxID=3079014 RepID=UPI0029168A92|nr:LPD1 domain-containing protein [Cupriavidus sp. BIC8F]